MLYYLFVKAQDIDAIIQEINTIIGIECKIISDNYGLLPEKYIEIINGFYSDIWLATQLKDTLKNKYHYKLLKSLHRNHVLI